MSYPSAGGPQAEVAQAACDRLTAIDPYSAFVTEADGLMAYSIHNADRQLNLT